MFAVIFVVQPHKHTFDDYLDHAKELKPILESIDGFIDNERFESKRKKGRVLSLSTWRDEKSVIRWRTEARHHGIQEIGRSEVFEDYHLRVGEVTTDTAPPHKLKVVEQRFDITEAGDARMMTITELNARQDKPAVPPDELTRLLRLDEAAAGLVEHETFESIYNPGKLLLLAGWGEAAPANAWTPASQPDVQWRHRQVRIIRDYSMRDRREAPQYYPPIAER
ncbi:MAG: antibiotic biosynthesis monooxygenase [Methylobacteriaceae bacterium]|nr:antibiotic biosynthesis monooxygenase [Methylobacteriaceae bacterium]